MARSLVVADVGRFDRLLDQAMTDVGVVAGNLMRLRSLEEDRQHSDAKGIGGWRKAIILNLEIIEGQLARLAAIENDLNAFLTEVRQQKHEAPDRVQPTEATEQLTGKG